MTQFSAVLQAAIDEKGWSQRELARQLERLEQTSVSRIFRGHLPKREAVDEISALFDRPTQAALTAAYLADVMPESGAQLVTVSTVQEGESSKSQYRPGRAPEGSVLRQKLDVIEQHAMWDVTVYNVVVQLAEMCAARIQPPSAEAQEASKWRLREDPNYRAAMEDLGNKKSATSRRKKKD